MEETYSESEAIRVEARLAERVRGLLRKYSLLNTRLKPKSTEGGKYVVFPIVNSKKASSILEDFDIPHEVVIDTFQAIKKARRLRGPVKSYKVVGDIVVFSRRAGLPIDAYIEAAKKVLEDNPRLKAAWLKMETFGEERIPKLIHLAGAMKTETVAKEYGIYLAVDIAKAYYNPRLAAEHYRIAELVNDGEVVLDMFTGIGAFPLHIAKRKEAVVYGIDVNLEGLLLASKSMKINKKLKGIIILINADAGKLPFKIQFDRIIMNLPRNSKQFLYQACKYVKDNGIIHIYLLTDYIEVELEDIMKIMLKEDCKVQIEKVKKVLDYSPSQSIYVIDLRVKKNGENTHE
ncbi:MAG: hypothetical protein F7C82_00380 [Desulfurococcales archaeon]|nr:hypothetical protein [Desulfurococcales archaeon]